ncbi:transketolase [Serratia marcescens]|uniref:Transketolase n=4 Tax=Serratia marcescens TaxID=615 RepID=A0A379YWQ8_SERMA|nr:transketolase [Serratia marcescens]KFL05134.1 transketolase [Serratia marcescens]QSO56525.1 transketolase [Serratia marcescens subsp. marcescens ATCC 13880]QSO61277.1 transketolase [Serratia marcescens subsp. marcescens ATCC 13880]QSO66027.1 transketolase [Serratia marcescens subsp. marcescens ATCC 13880]QSO70778.1 transketolase [Serratia marcescens subsp. marcescens ATCC 13880]
MSSRKELANAIRALSMDAVQKANSGHPGAPMGMADIAEVLWRDYLNHNPTNPHWADRDRFVLSNGHGSMLIYSLLHLTGYDLPMRELENFRQLHSKTPGHPEYGYTPGVETTTGPLGQGIANAVGFAIAERTLAAQFNRPGHDIVDHHTYAFMGDGCMMEGISHEVCSLAGTLKLGKLTAFYDDNGISIDGHVDGWFTDDTALRFEAYGWHVVRNVDGHNPDAIKAAIEEARKVTDKPSLLMCKTVIGFGSPNKAGTHDVHGAALGAAEVAATREALGWKYAAFEIPQDIYAQWDAKEAGQAKEAAWNDKFAAYAKAFPELAAEFKRRMNGELPADWKADAKAFVEKLQANPANIASRKASQNALEAFGKVLPEFLGGSADLAPSNLTMWSGSKALNVDPAGNYIHYGVREFGMTAITNGIALHGGFLPYSATFLMFVEYARNAVRMAALMKLRNVFVYTHDSIGLGEDGPTHQPVEQLASLRVTPNMSTWRPCDQVESAVAWQYGIERNDGPTTLVFSRQNLTQQPRTAEQLANVYRGGYVLKDCAGTPDVILIATGSEVGITVEAADKLTAAGRKVRVVSMPSTDAFDKQDAAYRESVLPAAVTARVAVEAGIADYWYKYVGLNGAIVGMTTFGESAPAEQLFAEFGFSVDNVVAKAQALLK